MEQSKGEITAEQVERAIAKPRNIDYRELPPGWRELAPDYVIAAEAADDWDAEHAALTRWRDSLPVAKVARWDAEHLDYELSPPMEWEEDWGTRKQYKTHSRDDARAWGYTIEGEPERPAPRFKVVDLDPALHETALAATRMLHCGKWPLSLPRVGELPGFDAWNTGPLTTPDWIAQLELLAEPAPPAPEPVCPEGVYTTERHDPSRGPETVIRWSSEETELFVGYRETEDDVKAARFYLELVTYRARQHAEGDRQRKLDAVRAAEEALEKAHTVCEAAHTSYREAEVVDVPQPRIVVKRCDEVEAEWTSADATILIVTHDALDDAIFVPIALLRAMLEAIDAQQGGAS